MSTFTQVNKGNNSKGVQVFSSSEKHRFKQYGGGTQIIDGVPRTTSNPIPNANPSSQGNNK